MSSSLKFFSVLLLFGVLFLSGCIGANGKKPLGFHDASECTQSELAAKALCLREAAITYSAQANQADAMNACNSVRNIDSSSSYYNTQADLCYYDVAKLFGSSANGDICANIQTTDDILLGSSGSRDMCEKQVAASSVAQNYTCGVLFVFPVVVLFAFWYRIH